MTLQQQLLKIKKEKRLKWKEIGNALGVSESFAFYLAHSKRTLNKKKKPLLQEYIRTEGNFLRKGLQGNIEKLILKYGISEVMKTIKEHKRINNAACVRSLN